MFGVLEIHIKMWIILLSIVMVHSTPIMPTHVQKYDLVSPDLLEKLTCKILII